MDRRTFAARLPLLAAASLGVGPAGWLGARAQGAIRLQTPTALPATTPQGWSFVALADGDLVAINRRGPKGRVEFHVVDAASGYQRFSLQIETGMASADENFDFVALPNRDVAAIFRTGASGRTEIHVLDAAKSYKSFRMQSPTALPASDRRWAFGADAEGHLVCINRLGQSGRTEVHVLDAAKGYGRFRLQTESALPATDSTWDFGVTATRDVVGIARRGESGKTEMHVLDATKDYKRFKLQVPTALAATDADWRFVVRDTGDVMAVRTRGGATGKTELHLLAGGKG